MTLASRFCSSRHSRRRLTQTGAHRNRWRAFNPSASFEALEDRCLLTSVSFSGAGESLNESNGGFSIAVTLSSPPSGTPTISHFASGFGLPPASPSTTPATSTSPTPALHGEQGDPRGDGQHLRLRLRRPLGLAFHAGNLYVADNDANTVDEVTSTGAVSTFARIDLSPALAFDSAGNLYVTSGDGHMVSKVTPAGAVSTFASGFTDPVGLAFDAAGNLYVANTGGNTVTKVTPAGVVSTFVSSSSGLVYPVRPGLRRRRQPLHRQPEPNHHQGDACGRGHHLRRTVGSAAGLAFDAAGNLYVANVQGGTVSKASQTVSVPFTLGGSAASGAAYSDVTTGPLTFGIGQTALAITGTLLFDPGPTQTLISPWARPRAAPPWESHGQHPAIAEPAAVQFNVGSETVNESAGTFSIPVTIAGTPDGTPTSPPSPPGSTPPSAWPSTPPATSTSPTSTPTR